MIPTQLEKDDYALLCSVMRACGRTPPAFEQWKAQRDYAYAVANRQPKEVS